MEQAKKPNLYFTADMQPTQAEREEAKQLGFTAFRNSRLVSGESGLEAAEAVAGSVPPGYLKVKGIKIVGKAAAAAKKAAEDK